MTIFDKIYLVPNKTDAHLENYIVQSEENETRFFWRKRRSSRSSTAWKSTAEVEMRDHQGQIIKSKWASMKMLDQDLNSRVWSWLRTNAGGVPNTCKSNGDIYFGRYLSGARVSNAWTTWPSEGDNTWKQMLIPHETTAWHQGGVKGGIRWRRGSRPIR